MGSNVTKKNEAEKEKSRLWGSGRATVPIFKRGATLGELDVGAKKREPVRKEGECVGGDQKIN